MTAKVFRYVPLLLALTALVVLPLSIGAAPVGGTTPAGPPFAPGRILVKFRPGASVAEKAAVHRVRRGRAVGVIGGIDVEVVSVPTGAERAKVVAYARSPLVAYAEPDYTAHALGDPNDQYFAKQWGMDNDGQMYKEDQSGTVDADIDFPEAWGHTTGAAEVKIAILDTGIDQNHPDLDDKLVGNKNCTDSSTVDDLYGHGTHVAGIAAAETNNGEGVAGVGHNSFLLNVKVLNDEAVGYYSWIADGIIWAADKGASVINMSLGGYRRSRTLEEAVNYAWGKDVVVVAAAGNDGTTRKLYPAAYTNCIAVAATDAEDQRVDEPGWWASNYGNWVDVAAPGLYIFSTFPNHVYTIGKSLSYDYGSGTSMSTPFVSGLAALLWSTELGTSNTAVRDRIQMTADPVPGTGYYWIHGRINACNAVGGECTYQGGGVEPTPEPGGTMHVAGIDMELATVQRGPNLWTYALAEVTILDQDGFPLEGATVYGHWSGATSDSDTGVTGADGTVSLESDKVKNVPGETTFTFTVDNVSKDGWTYDASANVESSDSIEF